MFQLSAELGGIQVAGELQAPCFVGCSELGVCAASGIPEPFMKEKGIFKIPVTVLTACRFCGNSLLGKLSRAVICNDLLYCAVLGATT